MIRWTFAADTSSAGLSWIRVGNNNTHSFNHPMSGTTRVSWYHKGKTNLDLLEQDIVSGSSIRWARDNHASTAPLSFYRLDAFPATQPTASKH